ncbi:MAG: hypothetical protein KAX15_00125, partial [Candidatus Omnitrophica bacterium]|nr:hypothetical protein [Candidatus Omnitrophota bacterium]
IKKVGPNLYRARLDKRNRILFSIYHYNRDTYALILEYIANHAYEKSRFLKRGAEINEDKIPVIADLTKIEKEPLRYINPKLRSFNVLDKVLSFDDIQNEIYSIIPPFIIIGSAGSGKTALALEKIKETSGDILYVTKSLFLAKHSRNLYYANNYSNENQEIAFLSFEEFLESIHVPSEKEMDFYTFNEWFCRHSYGSKIKNPHKLFEEFRGVLTGAVTNKSRLDRNDYIALGVRQSIFTKTERGNVYDIFEKYLLFLKEGGYYDPNILSFEYQSLCVPQYDFIAVDEIQDITNVQLSLILKTLRFSNSFILCGDSNQIVPPNFFSWAKVKTHFYNKKASLVPDYNQRNPAAPDKLIFILNSNYRNSRQITAAANRILRL